MSAVPVSAVIITFNEEKNIRRCLESLQGIADDIVVLDSYSTDATPVICREMGVRFFQHPFDGHIEQKNRAITYARYPHVLSLDADEALDDTLREEIFRVKKNFSKNGYYIPRLTYYCGKWIRYSGWYPDLKLRLWDSRKGRWTGINPHDRYELYEGDKNTGRLKGNILHYSYYSLEDHYRQVEYFTNIASRAYYEKKIPAPFYKLIVNPVAKFIAHYFLHAGFLDGKEGFHIARISAYATWLKYKKLRDLYHQESNKNA